MTTVTFKFAPILAVCRKWYQYRSRRNCPGVFPRQRLADLGTQRDVAKRAVHRPARVEQIAMGKDPDSGRRVRRERPESEWTVTECPILIDEPTGSKVQVRMRERATGRKEGRGVRRYVLSGLLICERCRCPMVIRGTNASHYGCNTYIHGGEAACSMGLHLSRRVAEEVLLGPIRSELLAPEAVDRFCEKIRARALSESSRVEQGLDPAVAAIDAEIADIGALIAARPARVATMRPLIEELRTKQANLRCGAARKAQSAKLADLPAVESYRAAVATLVETLGGSNVEAARKALRGLVGTVLW